jgi:hypothetical protein
MGDGSEERMMAEWGSIIEVTMFRPNDIDIFLDAQCQVCERNCRIFCILYQI